MPLHILRCSCQASNILSPSCSAFSFHYLSWPGRIWFLSSLPSAQCLLEDWKMFEKHGEEKVLANMPTISPSPWWFDTIGYFFFNFLLLQNVMYLNGLRCATPIRFSRWKNKSLSWDLFPPFSKEQEDLGLSRLMPGDFMHHCFSPQHLQVLSQRSLLQGLDGK